VIRPLRRLSRLAWVALVLATACASTPAPRRAGPEPAWATPPAWRATQPGTGAVLYLLGSIHVGTDTPRPFHPRIREAFERSDSLVVEIDFTAISEAEMARAWQARAVPEGGRTLRDLVSDEVFEKLLAYLAERGLPLDTVLHLEPWAAYLKLTRLALEAEGYAARQGVDLRFLAEAAGRLPIVGLETPALQLALFDGFDRTVQETMLLGVIDPDEAIPTEVWFRAWETGDEAVLRRLFFGPSGEEAVWDLVHEKIYFERNERMAERLDALSRVGSTRFVVVGAGHLVGPRSLPALLEARGFRVDRLVPEGQP